MDYYPSEFGYEREHNYWEEVERSEIKLLSEPGEFRGKKYDAKMTIKYKNVSGVTPLICPNRPHAYSTNGFCQMCMPFKTVVHINTQENLRRL